MEYKTCPYKWGENHSCKGNYVSGPVICNMVKVGDNEAPWESCGRFGLEETLHELLDNAGVTEFCCPEMRMLFHDCAEEDGYLAGGFDILKNHTDQKMVWRNFHRTHFRFCPYCGSKLGKPFTGRYATDEGEVS